MNPFIGEETKEDKAKAEATAAAPTVVSGGAGCVFFATPILHCEAAPPDPPRGAKGI